jgi:Uri superfamily endonuclease
LTISTFPSLPGAYLLVLTATQGATIRVGRLGQLDVTPGCYLYAGSALGAGGLRGRLRHHLHLAARPHWHVDYLRAVTELVAVWWLATSERLEHRWARALAQASSCSLPMPRFGASDCRCPAHLFSLPEPPSRPLLERLLSPAPDHCTVLNTDLTSSCGSLNPPGTARM